MTEEIETVTTDISPIPEAQEQSSENNDMLPKTTVSKIVERERLKAFEKGKQEALMELQQQQAQAQEQQPMQQQAPAQQQNIGGMPQMSQADIERLIMQKAPEALMQQVQQLKTKNMVDTFVGKMDAAEQKYPGLEAKLNQLNYNDQRIHSLIEMANNLDNTAEVMKDLVDNPNKLMQVLAGIQDQPYLARETINSLSNSIKQNQQALEEQTQARNPMSALKPSTGTGMDNGAMSVNDYRNMFRKERR